MNSIPAQPTNIRPARPEDVRPAFAFAHALFLEYVWPVLESPARERMREGCESEDKIARYLDGRQLMFIVWAGPHMVGMVCESRGDHISKLYVARDYQRRGVATALMDDILRAMAAPRVTVNASPYGLPFYLRYGFAPTNAQQNRDGFIYTPMAFAESSLKMNQTESFAATVALFDRPGGWYYVAVPERLCKPYYDLQDRGLIAITATAKVAGTQMTWQTSLLPMGDGSHFLALPAKARTRLGISKGNCVEIEFSIRQR